MAGFEFIDNESKKYASLNIYSEQNMMMAMNLVNETKVCAHDAAILLNFHKQRGFGQL